MPACLLAWVVPAGAATVDARFPHLERMARAAHAGKVRHVGVVVVWRHHVGRITDVSGSRIRVLSGNDGRAVRNRWRTTRGVIA